MSTKKKYCCRLFRDAVEGMSDLGGIPPFILYAPKWRMYGVIMKKDPSNQWILHYCPFCGKKLPKDLCDEYYYAVRDDTGKVLDPLPKEFETDEWWKRRGL